MQGFFFFFFLGGGGECEIEGEGGEIEGEESVARMKRVPLRERRERYKGWGEDVRGGEMPINPPPPRDGGNFHYKGIYRCAAAIGYTFQASK